MESSVVSWSVGNLLKTFTDVMTSSIIRLSDNGLVVLADNKSSMVASSEIDMRRFREMKSSVNNASVIVSKIFFPKRSAVVRESALAPSINLMKTV